MKKLIVCVLVLALMVASFITISCNSKTEDSSTAMETETATVKRGNISIDITASGNLITSREANLTFGSASTVNEVLVGIGDYVEEGQVLAKIDTLNLETSVNQAEINVKSAQLSLERAKEPKTSASGTEILSAPDPLDIEIKEFQLENAKMSLQEEQEKLEKATLTAPFAGLIAEVNIIVGDEISENTVVMRLIDPTQFEVEVMVSEMEVYQINVGTPATVTVTALPTLALPASVAHISPVATIQSNVVNYTVQVKLSSLEALTGAQPQATQPAATGEMPDRLRQALESGQMTQEQVDAMMARRQQRPQQQQTPVTMSPDFHLREGLTVTVTIVVDQRANVLLVPNGAITSQGSDKYVQVVSSAGVTEQRAVQTGISNWQYTEVTEGLSEGEQISVPQGSTVNTTTTNQQQRPPGGFVPGMGRMLR